MLLFINTGALAQNSKIKPLTVGDTLPEIVLKGFFKDSLKKEKLSGYYKDKLLLIDLSATWCEPCVKAWPELDSLKTFYKDKLEVLVVTQEKRERLNYFFKTHPDFKKLNMNFIIDNLITNKVLAYSFLTKMVPQVIWINAMGKVVAITEGEAVTRKNIETALNNQQLNLKIKKDVMDFNIGTYELNDSTPLYKSIITAHKDGINSGSSMRPNQNVDEVKFINDILFLNLDVGQLYLEAAYPHHSISHFNKERIIWEISDSLRMKYDYSFAKTKSQNKDPNSWNALNGYCYELKTRRVVSAPYLYNQMINELNIIFDLNGHFEKRLLPCWVLKSSNPATIKTNGANPEIIYKAGVANVLKNQPVSKLAFFLNRDLNSGYIINETGIDFNIDIDLTGFTGFVTTPETMNNVFFKYNLRLEKATREIDVFVIASTAM